MTIFKISTFILFYFVARMAFTISAGQKVKLDGLAAYHQPFQEE